MMSSQRARNDGSAAHQPYDHADGDDPGSSQTRVPLSRVAAKPTESVYRMHGEVGKLESPPKALPAKSAGDSLLKVVEASGKFLPDSVSTLSISVAADRSIDHRFSVLADHSGLMVRALRALASRIEDDGD
ncbi:hypothetical protein [Burkholderia gladioli]|uniref:hypothetical protein n=1 Tax=Burkholderia gladioli TaxID=28095 RepID=UPI00163EB660|nr:hypothetical protein [Burkholderia gladioli]